MVAFEYERVCTRSTVRVYRADWVQTFKVCIGKIEEFREYTDTATIVEALTEGCRYSDHRIGKYILVDHHDSLTVLDRMRCGQPRLCSRALWRREPPACF